MAFTFSMESISKATPRKAKNSAATGIMTPSAAVRALTVSKPNDGWQSIKKSDRIRYAPGVEQMPTPVHDLLQ